MWVGAVLAIRLPPGLLSFTFYWISPYQFAERVCSAGRSLGAQRPLVW
jgi:hypothetical protein